jgi:patatin-related protein
MREKELRVALVCFGGISLAVYMHGVSKEILKLVRASRTLHGIGDRSKRASARADEVLPGGAPEYDTEAVYFDLLQAIGKHVELRVIVDVIAGASAGGINGVMLARALAHDLPVAHLRDMWLESGDVAELLAPARRARRWSKPFMSPFVWALSRSRYSRAVRDEEVRQKISLFVRSRWFKPPLDGTKMSELMFTALDRMGDPVDVNRTLLPTGLTLDLFVTLTDFFGYQQLIEIHDPVVIREREHRHVLHFRHRRSPSGAVRSDFLRDDVAALAFAARATSAFPGAFPPAQIREIDAMLAAAGRSWPGRTDFIRSNFERYHRAGLDPEATSFLDGSVLNNKPFAEALEAIRTRPAYRPVDRRLVYIDPDPVQPAPPPGGRSPGFFATLKGALSDLPRNEPIAEQLDAIARYNDRVRKRRAIIDSARPEIARLVTELEQARTDGTLSSADIGAWREAANEHAAHNAGFAYQGYVRQKLDSVQSYVARFVASVCRLRDGSPEARIVDAIITAWARRRDIVYREDPATRSAARCDPATAPPWIRFLHAFDVEFRQRRLAFLIQGQNRLYAKFAAEQFDEARGLIDGLKREFYRCLDTLRRYESEDFRASTTCSDLREVFAVPPTPEQMGRLDHYAEQFAADNEAALTRLLEHLADEIDLDAATHEIDVLLAGMDATRWPADARREVLVNYIGFPFWDVLTLAVTSWRDLGEFDEIRVDRISPEDAQTLTRIDGPPTLRGTAFMHFGAFFSRAARENDYLLGRLQAIDRLIDIVCDSAGAEALGEIDVAGLKRRAFAIVLEAEGAHLTLVQPLVEQLRSALLHPSRSDRSAP